MPEVRGGLRWQVWWQVRWRWQLDMAMWVAVSVAMKTWWQVWWQNVMAKMVATVFWWQRGWQLCMAKIEPEVRLAITFWRQQRCQNLMAAFWTEEVANTFSHKKALSVHGTCWQKGCERLFGGKWGGKLMAKVLAKFGATSTIERDVDKNHASPIAPSAEATPTDPMN